MVYDHEKVSLNFTKRRVTDIKGNARVIMPKRVKNFDEESRLDMLYGGFQKLHAGKL